MQSVLSAICRSDLGLPEGARRGKSKLFLSGYPSWFWAPCLNLLVTLVALKKFILDFSEHAAADTAGRVEELLLRGPEV